MSLLTDGNLLPFRQYNESDVLQLWSLDGTGLNGQLVTIQAAGQDPATSMGAYRNASPAPYAPVNVANYGYGIPRKVRPTNVNDNKFSVVGLTLHTTAINDENGNPLVSQPYNRTLERGFVQTGFAVPVLTRGVVTLKFAQVNGNANPGDIGVAGANGVINVVANTAANVITTSTGAYAVGKFISSSGSAFGGYYQFKLEL